MLGEKMKEHNVNIWLINTGWSGGEYGVGSRISLKYTRAMITAVLEGKLGDYTYEDYLDGLRTQCSIKERESHTEKQEQ